MKKYVSMKPIFGLAVVVLMTSCVAKRKYTDAQNTITQLQTENAQLRETGTGLQTNVTSLEAKNRALQSSLDSTNTWATGQQTRWNSYSAFYDEGVKTTDQVHQQLHSQLDELIGAENITNSGGRVVVTLAEKTLFASGSSKLTAKGTEVLTTLAQAIKDNPSVEIDIASAPGFYSGMATTTSSMSTDMNTTTTTMDNTKVKTDDDMKYKDENTKVKVDRDGDAKVKIAGSTTKAKTSTSTAKKSSSYSGTAKKSTGTVRKSSETKSKTYASNPARKTTTSGSATWSLNMARSSSIAKKLVDEGVAKSRILVNNKSTSDGNKDFQVIISPKSDTYYESIGNGMNK